MANGGRKVYRQGKFIKKQRMKKVFGFFFGTIVFAALVFLGYSVAKPIYNYINSEDVNNITESEPPWTPPVFTEAPENNGNSVDSEDEDKDKDKDDAPEQTGDETGTVNNNTEESFTAFMLTEDALFSEAKLNQSIAQAKADGYNAVIAIMKARGGKINYKTSSKLAASDKNAIVGTLDASKIASVIKSSGLKSIAYLNFLEDNNRYGESRDGSYHSTDGTTWLDNSVAKGGKSWLSPFDTQTQGYVSQLSAEAASAGFDVVIAGGVRFPNFRKSDLNLIGGAVKSETRYQSLITIANISKSAVTGNKKDFMLEINVSSVINGTEEVFKPDSLEGVTLMVEYSPEELKNTIVYNNREIVLSELTAADKFAAVFGIISEKAGPGTEIVPLIRRDDYNQADFSDIISTIIRLNYKSYIVQ